MAPSTKHQAPSTKHQAPSKTIAKKWSLEDHLNDYIKKKFTDLKLENGIDYYVESAIPDYLKEALKGRAKTENKTNFGKPDFSLTKYDLPILIENKLGLKKLISVKNNKINFEHNALSSYAVNGALYYATGVIASQKYKDAIAIGISGDSEEDIQFKIYYVYGSGHESFKELEVNSLNFLETKESFNEFYKNALLTEEEKHEILIKSREDLQKQAKTLNKLMHNLNITASHRVLYVSGALLSMQPIFNKNPDGTEEFIKDGLTPEDLKGSKAEKSRDGIIILNHIEEFLKYREIPEDKRNLMISSFHEISKDIQRDEKIPLNKEVSKLLPEKSSTNKQIFTFIYHHIFLSIDATAGHLDIMGEMYSEFLKYALGDGKEIGIVLTPPYITEMMSSILDIDRNSRVMDLATGSAGFLISAMEHMIDDAEREYGRATEAAQNKIDQIKKEQLLGVEFNAEMYTLAATNMILRGDGSAKIEKGNTFDRPPHIYKNFKANRLLLNPPFSYKENGMPFIEFGLNHMEPNGLGAIIIQDSAGSGKAVKTNQKILKKHTLLASIKMPMDLFQPQAGVQTSIYIFESHKKHDFERTVKFIDFRNDGYKRTSRSLQELDNPTKRYRDIIKIYKNGTKAKIEADWNLEEIYIEDYITNSGADWNFDQHKKIETKPTFDDFRKTVTDYLSWEVDNILRQENSLGKP